MRHKLTRYGTTYRTIDAVHARITSHLPKLVGVAHLRVYTDDGHPVGELGISVLPEARHRHLGRRLLARTLLHARLRQLKHVYVQVLVRNRPLARLACAFTELVDSNLGEARATIEMDEGMRVVA